MLKPNLALQLPSNAKKFLHFLFMIGILLGSTIYVHNHSQEINELFQINWHYTVLLIVIAFFLNLVTAARFNVLYLALSAKTHLMESFGLSLVASSLNALLPAEAGGVARAMYLKSRHAIPYSHAPAIFLVSLILYLSITSFAIFVLGLINFSANDPGALLFISLGFAFAGLSAFPFFINVPKSLTYRWERMGNMLRLFSVGWKTIRSDRNRLLKACIYQIVAIIIRGWGILVAFESLGLDINPRVGLNVFFLAEVLSVIHITPGNLGITEGLVGSLSHLTGLTFVQGAAAFALWRVSNWLIYFVGAPVAWYFLFYCHGIQIRSS
jgi:uncharacterized protein (TIRG00374 family)